MIVFREEWGHPGPLGPLMDLPASILYVHHSVTAEVNGPPHTVANIGIERFGRSSYSYAITPDGIVYEMQGIHQGAHTAGQNSTSLAVVLVGNYDTDTPTPGQAVSVVDMYLHLVDSGALVADAPLLGHRDAPGAVTACPGRHAYGLLPALRADIANAADSSIPEEGSFMGNVVRERENPATMWLSNGLQSVRLGTSNMVNQYAYAGFFANFDEWKAEQRGGPQLPLVDGEFLRNVRVA